MQNSLLAQIQKTLEETGSLDFSKIAQLEKACLKTRSQEVVNFFIKEDKESLTSSAAAEKGYPVHAASNA
ncbi:MAG: hypothetical protein D6B25_18010 [Desulfobulbaceae bacterium]|nr:MAG: hypothetical protein D6B25_18010 [Desulfobulbaceae bacterium]